jgi:hypothetical protein
MAATGSAIRAGRAFVELFADPSKLYRTLEQARKKFEASAAAIRGIGFKIGGVGMAALAPLTGLFTAAVGEGAEIEQLAEKYATSAEKISELRGAFKQAGVGGQQFASILENLSLRISHAADSNDFLLDSLQSLGRGRDFMGKDAAEQFEMIADRIKAIPNAIDQIRAAEELGLGPMLKYLKQGSEGFKELYAQAVKNGDVMNSADAKAAAQIQLEYNRSLIAVKNTLLEVGKALLPVGKDFAQVGAELRAALADVRQWITDNREVIQVVAGIAGALIGAGVGIVSGEAT